MDKTGIQTLVREHEVLIGRSGQIAAARTAYVRRNVELYGPKQLIPAARTIAARVAKAGQPPPRSSVVQVGEAPDGFGKQVLWDAADEGLAVLVFLNAADYL